MCTEKFGKYDYSISYACVDKEGLPDIDRNTREYYSDTTGSGTTPPLAGRVQPPPIYDFSKIKGFNIALLCGKEDLLASPGDYMIMNDQLKNQNNVTFIEYDQGHLGFLIPLNLKHIYDALEIAGKC